MGRQIGHGDAQGIVDIHNAKPWCRTHRIRKIKSQIRFPGKATKTAFAYTRFLYGLKEVPNGYVPGPEPREVKEIVWFIAKAGRFLTRVNQSSTEHKRDSFSS